MPNIEDDFVDDFMDADGLSIDFFAEDVEYPLPFNETELTQWIEETIAAENQTYNSINFIFCSDAFLLQMNQEHLQHDYYTDVITFPYHESGEPIEGEVYISVERTAENAQTVGVSPLHELYRVMIHGVLHLCGYDDHSPKDKAEMTDKENHYLQQLEGIN
jgi:rRNA maturation RNase YbeY